MESAIALDVAYAKIDVTQHAHHGRFRRQLIENLLSTPWCKPKLWKDILNDPFSKNVTLQNLVPRTLEDDNQFFNGGK